MWCFLVLALAARARGGHAADPPSCPDLPPEGGYTCAQQKSWGQCSKDWMFGSCCRTCFGCADGCGRPVPPRPPCSEQAVEPEGAPGAGAAALFGRLKAAWAARDTTFSGQTTSYYDELAKQVGKSPAVRAFEMQNYSPHNPWHADWSSWDDGNVADAIAWHKSTGGRGIVSFQWHWFSPMGGNLSTSTFFSKYTDFDTARAVVNGTAENAALLRDLGAIARQLARLRDAGVPVLWRPLHEARGNDAGAWFWWGSAGPRVLLRIYDLMRGVFLGEHGLDNLIWVWSEPSPEWYPGNDKVDVLGVDSYPHAHDYGCNEAFWNQYLAMTDCRKMLALSEVGAIPDFGACYGKGVRWLYFLAWSSRVAQDNTVGHLRSVYSDAHVRSVEDSAATPHVLI